jgi:hypothetical protein
VKKLVILVIFAFVGSYGFSQLYSDQDVWKRYKTEIVYGAGTSFFFGDLGGGVGEGKHFLSVSDINAEHIRPAVEIGIRRRFANRLAFRTNLSYAMLRADDANSGNEQRKLRNLNFKSHLIELSGLLEFSILNEKRHFFYMFSRTKSPLERINLYTFAGAGIIGFDPCRI